MLGALIIVFREVIEAGIIVGIMLAVTKGVPGRGRWIATGVGAGIAGASLLAVFADQISNALAGIGQELFNAAILFVAVIMLAWHNIWMARHGRQLAAQMKEVGDAVAKGSRSTCGSGDRGRRRGASRGFGNCAVSLWLGDRG